MRISDFNSFSRISLRCAECSCYFAVFNFQGAYGGDEIDVGMGSKGIGVVASGQIDIHAKQVRHLITSAQCHFLPSSHSCVAMNSTSRRGLALLRAPRWETRSSGSRTA